MAHDAYEAVDALGRKLWEAADELRANSKLTSSQYSMPVLGLIFLRHASNRHEAVEAELKAEQAAGRMPPRPLLAADFRARRAMMLPEKARYPYLIEHSALPQIPQMVNEAMEAIEEAVPELEGVLPHDFSLFEPKVLERLLRYFDDDGLRRASGDVFGRIYEYFLMKFAMDGAQDKGEFFTPPSLVQTIVNIIEPKKGKLLDPACGSAGMFVQSSHFIEEAGGKTEQQMVFYGQEKTAETIRLAKMNLAVHGLDGHIAEANTFYEDRHELVGKCDFVMANPPFNVDKVDAKRVAQDTKRVAFGLPGTNKDGNVPNGNYLWISYFWSYLNPTGRAGFVMSSQASSAGNQEKLVRQKLVETGDVDVMVAIRSNFFYTLTVPCELWFFDKGKPTERKDTVLMLDLRQVFRKVSRKLCDFSAEQLANIAAIVRLYRGETERFLATVQAHLDNAVGAGMVSELSQRAALLAVDALTDLLTPLLEKTDPGLVALQQARQRLAGCQAALLFASDKALLFWSPVDRSVLGNFVAFDQDYLAPLSAQAQETLAALEEAGKAAAKAVEEGAASNPPLWPSREINRSLKQIEATRQEAVSALADIDYYRRAAAWLYERFPNAELVPVPGLVRAVTRAEIEAADWSLTPGRYVGVAPQEQDEDFDFAGRMRELHEELADLNAEAGRLAEKIQLNYEAVTALWI